MQVTGHLPFISMLWAGHLHGRLHVHSIVHQVRGSWKSQAASAIDQTSDWSLAIHFMLNKLVTCPTKCSIYFNWILIGVKCLISLLSCSTAFNLLLHDAVNFVNNKVTVYLLIFGEELALQPLVYSFELPGGCHPVS